MTHHASWAYQQTASPGTTDPVGPDGASAPAGQVWPAAPAGSASPAGPPAAPGRPRHRGAGWLRMFFGGLGLWVATVVVTFLTHNANLIPAIILLGSFLIPVTFVANAFRHADAVVSAQRIFTAFICGGLLGVLGASLLEAAFLRQPSILGYAGVGLIEEAVKLTALWLVARRLARYTARDGMILGAAVGFGFAAFESAGYAFNALFTSQGLSLLDLVETEVLRGILAPLGHGLWTAILGGAMFAAAARRGRLRLTGPVFGWFLVVALLHFLWDATNGIAVWLTLLLTGTESQWTQVELGRVLNVSEAQVHLYTVLNWALLAMDGLVGLLIGWIRWQRSAPVVPARPGRSGA